MMFRDANGTVIVSEPKSVEEQLKEIAANRCWNCDGTEQWHWIIDEYTFHGGYDRRCLKYKGHIKTIKEIYGG